MTPPSRSTGSLNWTRDEQIAVPSADRERRMAVRYHDWQRIKRSLDRISHPLPKLEVVFSFLFGIAATSGFSMVAAQAAQTSSPWVMMKSMARTK